MAGEADKQVDYKLKAAERAHDQVMKGFEIHSKQVESFSLAAMRAPALVSAGGVAASLGFYSANFQRFSGKPEALHLFNDALMWLLIGLLITLVSPCLAYFSQLAYSDSLSSRRYTWEHPFVEETRRSRIAQVVGDIMRWSCVASVLGAITSVAIGGIRFLDLVSSL
jgi:hypothetical protein